MTRVVRCVARGPKALRLRRRKRQKICDIEFHDHLRTIRCARWDCSAATRVAQDAQVVLAPGSNGRTAVTIRPRFVVRYRPLAVLQYRENGNTLRVDET